MAAKDELFESDREQQSLTNSTSIELAPLPLVSLKEERGDNHNANEPSVTREEFNSAAEIESRNEQSPFTYLKGWKQHLLTLAFVFTMLKLNPFYFGDNDRQHINRINHEHVDRVSKRELDSHSISSYIYWYTPLPFMCHGVDETTGFLMILAKSSDTFGRKTLILFSVLVFTTFSGACGASQTLLQLIVFRAFQGIGGGGIYTMVFVIGGEMVPPDRYASLAAVLSSAYALSAVLGPVLGGLINDNTTWRWVFLLNLPAGLVGFVTLAVAMPTSFPHGSNKVDSLSVKSALQVARQVDFLGAFLQLAASMLLVTALEEGGTMYSWRSPVTLSLLFVSLAFWVAFVLWQRMLHSRNPAKEAILPWRLVQDRFFMAYLLNALFVGAVFITVVITLPQRFQVVNQATALGAGWRMLPLMLCTPLASAISAYLIQQLKIPPVYVFFAAAILQTIGLALISAVSTSQTAFPRAIYGYEAILGLGTGMSLSSVILAAPTIIAAKDSAVFMGVISQARALGGSVGLAVSTNVLMNNIRSDSGFLTSDQLSRLLETADAIGTLPLGPQSAVRQLYAAGYNQQMEVLTAFSGATVLATLMMWEKKPRRMP